MKTAKWNLICRMNTIKWYYTTSHKFYEKIQKFLCKYLQVLDFYNFTNTENQMRICI